MKAILTIGISASGKTTWAKQFVAENPNWVIICRDDIRAQLMGGVLDWRNWQWSREDEVTKIQTSMILAAKVDKKNIIIADTNLPSVKNGRLAVSNGDKLANKLKLFGYDVEMKEFDISIEEAIARDKGRPTSVGEGVLITQYEKWLAYKNCK